MSSFRAELTDCLVSIWEVLQDSSMSCVLRLDGRLDLERLRRAMRLTLDAEPILGCRFEERWYRPVWRRRGDLDRIALCQSVDPVQDASGPMEAFVAGSLDPTRDCQVKALLVRGASSDTLVVKLSHKVADGQALKQYVYCLAQTYRELMGNGAYRPPGPASYNRSLRALLSRFDAGRREELREFARENRPVAVRMGRWGTWADRAGQGAALDLRQLDEARHATVFRYALKQRATVLHVMMAALFHSAVEVLPHTERGSLPIWSVVDLRRYACRSERAPLCNMFGLIHVAGDPCNAGSLDALVDDVRDQMVARRKRLGLTAPPFNLESRLLSRLIVKCVPYRASKRFVGRRLSSVETGIPLLTDVGNFDPARLDFGEASASDAFAVSGRTRSSALFLLCMSSFGGRLTVASNASDCEPTATLMDGMWRVLPE